jgi:hypothetical protein
MNAKELRIGNYVHHNTENSKTEFIGNELTVCELTEKTITTFYLNIDGSKQIVRGKAIYLPIPLTERWLQLFGFTKNDYKAGFIGKDFKSGNMILDFVLSEPRTKGEWNHYYTYDFQDYRFKSIEFVHELQNLYFLLTGSELSLSGI